MPPPRSLPTSEDAPPRKKQKLSSASSSSDRMKDISTLEQSLMNSVSPANLHRLVSLAKSLQDVEQKTKAIFALYRVFVTYISAKALLTTSNEHKAELWEQLNEYSDHLASLVAQPVTGKNKDASRILGTSALQILLAIQKSLSSAFSHAKGEVKKPEWHNKHFTTHVLPAIISSSSDHVLETFVKNYLSEYVDLRWFFMRDTASYLKKHADTAQPIVILRILELVSSSSQLPSSQKEFNENAKWFIEEFGQKPPKPSRSNEEEDEDEDEAVDDPNADEDDWRKFFDDDPKDKDQDKKPVGSGQRNRVHNLTLHQSLHSLPSHRAVFTHLWLTLLPLLPSSGTSEAEQNQIIIRTLDTLHSGSVLKSLTRPVLIMDFVGGCLDRSSQQGEGVVISMLSLNLVWELIRGWNLDYPQFYTRLYALLTRDVLHVKWRARFFRLLDLFLSSTLLPSHLIASFVKRLSLLSLSAPPSGIIIILPLVYKLLKKNPVLMGMIHRDAAPSEELDGANDPYNPDHPNPLLSQALLTSLWELETHANRHYHGGIGSLGRVFSEPFTREELGGKAGMEEWLDHSFGSMINHELSRKHKKDRDPSLSFELEVATVDQLRKEAERVEGLMEDEDDGRWSGIFSSTSHDDDRARTSEESALTESNGSTHGRSVVEELWDFGI